MTRRLVTLLARPLGAALSLGALGACSSAQGTAAPTADPVTITRPSQATACVAWPRPTTLHGLPLTDAVTKRISPDAIGEQLTWRGGRRKIVAWVGINAMDALEDLDFTSIGVHGTSEQWASVAFPGLYLADHATGFEAPCDHLYVSTQGLSRRAGPTLADSLHVRWGPSTEVLSNPPEK